ncbi:MAG: hypothetical protein NC082_04715 [Clostridiales bacterium]|nr:hypothetical protein [Clostridiales bacterium]
MDNLEIEEYSNRTYKLYANDREDIFFESLPWYKDDNGVLHRPYKFVNNLLEYDCADNLYAARFVDRHNHWTLDFTLSEPGLYDFN